MFPNNFSGLKLKITPNIMSDTPQIKKSCRFAAFTLIELLVCVAIIGVLAALIVPALGRMIDSASCSKTVGNLRTLQTANITYAADHDGFFVANWPASSASYQNGWWQYGPFVEYLGGDIPDGTENLGWDAWPDAAKTGLNVNPHINTGGDKKDRFGTVAMNMSRFSHWTSGDPMLQFNTSHFNVGMIKQSAVAFPNDFIMFADGAGYFVDYQQRLNWANLPADRQDKQVSNGLAFRGPGKTAYVAVASGAVKSLRPEDVRPNTPEVQRMFYYNGAQ